PGALRPVLGSAACDHVERDARAAVHEVVDLDHRERGTPRVPEARRDGTFPRAHLADVGEVQDDLGHRAPPEPPQREHLVQVVEREPKLVGDRRRHPPFDLREVGGDSREEDESRGRGDGDDGTVAGLPRCRGDHASSCPSAGHAATTSISSLAPEALRWLMPTTLDAGAQPVPAKNSAMTSWTAACSRMSVRNCENFTTWVQPRPLKRSTSSNVVRTRRACSRMSSGRTHSSATWGWWW